MPTYLLCSVGVFAEWTHRSRNKRGKKDRRLMVKDLKSKIKCQTRLIRKEDDAERNEFPLAVSCITI